MKPEALFFDMDGTLVDSEPVNYLSYAALLSEYGCALEEENFISFVGVSAAANLAQLKKSYNLPDPVSVLQKKKQGYYYSLIHRIHTFPRVPVLLAAAAKKRPLVLVTSTPSQFTTPILAQNRIGHLFVHIVTGDEALPKPDPALYHLALARVKCIPSAAIAFEDSLAGYQAAHTAGIACVVIPNKYTIMQFPQHHPTYSSLEEALEQYL